MIDGMMVWYWIWWYGIGLYDGMMCHDGSWFHGVDCILNDYLTYQLIVTQMNTDIDTSKTE